MNPQTATAKTALPLLGSATAPLFWRTRAEARLGTGIEFVYDRLPGMQTEVNYALNTLGVIRVHRYSLGPAFTEACQSPKAYGLGVELAPDQPPHASELVVDSGTVWHANALGAVLSGEPQGLVFVLCTAEEPNVTAGLVSSDPFDPTLSHHNRAELEALRANADDDWVTPTDYAYREASAILDACPDAPSAFMTTDSEGGIRMAWHHGEKQVRVNFGGRPDLKSYVYYESPEAHGIEDLRASNLQKRLRWLGV